MDAHDFARLASQVSQERTVINTALAVFRSHHVGSDWRGLSRQQAELAREAAVEACARSLAALDDAEREALRLWREALRATSLLGV
jgi:hypothetical protein